MNNTQREHMKTAEGITWKARQSTVDDTYAWEVKLFGKVLASGTAPDKKAARVALEKHLGAAMLKTEEKHASRNGLAMKLKRYMQTRPYIFVHVLNALVAGESMESTADGAQAEERRRYDVDKKATGRAWPIPTHHLALSAEDVARRVYEAAELYGLKGKRALNYGRKYFGPAFGSSLDADVVAEMDAEAERAKAEDDAR